MARPVQRHISQVVDVGATGDWMFKQQEMVFGPVPAVALVEKLYLGEIDGDTLVAPSDGHFQPLRSLPVFTVHLAKAEARQRVQRDTDVFRSQEQRGRRTRTTVTLVLVGGALIAAVGCAYWLVVDRQRRLQQEIDEIPITMNAPELSVASGNEDEIELPAAGAPGGPAHAVHRAPAGVTAGHKATDGLAEINYDKSSIIGAELRQKPTLIPCIRQELQRTPTFRGDIKFTVAVGNDGHVAKLWMEDPQFQTSPLATCFEQKMGAWKFASYEGERATLSDSFRVGH